MADPYFRQPSSINTPAANAVAVTPNDAADQTTSFKALYIGSSGNLKVEVVGAAPGTSVTFNNLNSGTILPVRVRKIYATGTTCANLVGLY